MFKELSYFIESVFIPSNSIEKIMEESLLREIPDKLCTLIQGLYHISINDITKYREHKITDSCKIIVIGYKDDSEDIVKRGEIFSDGAFTGLLLIPDKYFKEENQYLIDYTPTDNKYSSYVKSITTVIEYILGFLIGTQRICDNYYTIKRFGVFEIANILGITIYNKNKCKYDEYVRAVYDMVASCGRIGYPYRFSSKYDIEKRVIPILTEYTMEDLFDNDFIRLVEEMQV